MLKNQFHETIVANRKIVINRLKELRKLKAHSDKKGIGGKLREIARAYLDMADQLEGTTEKSEKFRQAKCFFLGLRYSGISLHSENAFLYRGVLEKAVSILSDLERESKTAGISYFEKRQVVLIQNMTWACQDTLDEMVENQKNTLETLESRTADRIRIRLQEQWIKTKTAMGADAAKELEKNDNKRIELTILKIDILLEEVNTAVRYARTADSFRHAFEIKREIKEAIDQLPKTEGPGIESKINERIDDMIKQRAEALLQRGRDTKDITSYPILDSNMLIRVINLFQIENEDMENKQIGESIRTYLKERYGIDYNY